MNYQDIQFEDITLTIEYYSSKEGIDVLVDVQGANIDGFDVWGKLEDAFNAGKNVGSEHDYDYVIGSYAYIFNSADIFFILSSMFDMARAGSEDLKTALEEMVLAQPIQEEF